MTLNSLLPGVILALILIITVSIIIFLVIIEKTLKRKVVIKQKKEENSPQRRIKLLISMKESPQKKVIRLDKIAREVFQDYNMNSNASYYEMAERFKQKGKRNAAKFCQEMFTIFYSGKELEQKKVEELTKTLLAITQQFQEERNAKNLERNIKNSIKDYSSETDILEKFKKIENKFIDKLAREKNKQEMPERQSAQPIAKKINPLPKITQIPIIPMTKREKLKDLPLIRLFNFNKKQPEIQKSFQKQPANISNIQREDENLKQEIISKQNQIENLETKEQIKRIEATKVDIEINKDKSWPPISFIPKHLDEIRKMPKEIEETFHEENKKIEQLEKEIKEKEKEVRMPSSSVKKLLDNVANKDSKNTPTKQIDLINLKKEPTNYSGYSAPKIIAPKKQKINALPKNKTLKKEEFIHRVDDMDRIRNKIYLRRGKIIKFKEKSYIGC